MKNKFLLLGNGPYLNRGCEAIVRGTINIINEYFDNTEYVNAAIFSEELDYKSQREAEIDSSIVTECIFGYRHKAKALDNICEKIARKINMHYNAYSEKELEILDKYIDNDVKAIISVGGDNYSLDYGYPDRFVAIDNYARRKNIPLIIWGASVGPFSKDKNYENKMKEHLKLVDGIFARENETVSYLKSIGVEKNVYRISDPAFHLEVIKPNGYNENDIKENSIGFNVSPLMPKFCNMSETNFVECTVKIITRLINESNSTIYLIPHVTIGSGSDYKLMSKVYNKIENKSRIVLINDKYNASELKWIISKMKVFFGARTHSTIAALSTNVPTLSFVYSIKSIGINKDIFGDDRFCIYPEMYNDNDGANKILETLKDSEKIKIGISKKSSEQKELSMRSGEYLKKILATK